MKLEKITQTIITALMIAASISSGAFAEGDNMQDLITQINHDTHLRTILKSFAGESFCLETCGEDIFLQVSDSGKVRIVEPPESFTRIILNENGLKIPFSLSSRLATAAMIS